MSLAVIRRIETSPLSPNLYKVDADGRRAGLNFVAPGVVERAVSETHAKTATVTRHPVEKGADISDYVRNGILGLEMEIGFSNNPIACERTERDGVFSGTDQTRIQAVWDAMLNLIDGVPSRQLLQVQTGLKLYDNMVVESIGTSQSGSNPDAIVIRVTFTQIRIVESSSARVRALAVREGEDQNRAQETVNLGDQIAPLLIDCEDCAVICAVCMKLEDQSDGSQLYVVDHTCEENGQGQFNALRGGIERGRITKSRACEITGNALTENNSVTYDRATFGYAQTLDGIVETADAVNVEDALASFNEEFGGLAG